MNKKFKSICKKNNSDIFFSILIPLLFFVLVFLIYQVYPLGDIVLAPYDARHQYVPFLEEFKYKLLHGENLFYSIRLYGTDFYLCWLYYLTSPFNILAIFFKDILLAFQFIIVLKICLISVSMCLYLRKKFGRYGIYTAVFSCAYSLSAYVLSYYFCTMWLDTLIIFPWLIYSFEMMLVKKKPWIYSLLLAAIIYSNFFMAMHVCIFLCVYFLFQSLENYYNHKKTSLFNFIFYSLIGGLISSPFFLPFMTLLGDKHKDKIDGNFLTSFADLFASFSTLSDKHTAMDYLSNANLFCGVVTLILFSMFLFDKKINIANRIKKGYLVIFLFVCANFGPMDYILNGLYQPNGYMGRYTYILIFFVVCGAFEEFLVFRRNKNKELFPPIISSLFTISFIYLFKREELSEDLFIALTAGFVISIVFFFILKTWFFDNKHKALIGMLSIELLFTGILNFSGYGYSDIFNTLDNIKKIPVETESRVAIIPYDIHSEATMLNYNSLSVFSSAIQRNTTKFPYMLGMRTGSNYISEHGSNGIPSLLYNIEYVYSKNDNYFGFNKIDESNNINLYKNNYETSYGYAVPKDMLDLNWDIQNPFVVLNRFVGYFLGEHTENTYIYSFLSDDELFLDSDYKKAIPKLGNNNIYNIQFEKGEGSYIEVSTIAKDSNICVNIKNGRLNKCVIYVNNEVFLQDSKIDGDIIYIDGVEKGDKVSVVMSTRVETGNIKVNFAYYDTNNFDVFASAFSDKRIDVTIDNNEIKGNYEIDDNEIIIISVPKIDGWLIKDNNLNSELLDFPIIAFNPNKKSGDFSMTYVTPLFKESLYISLFCFIILVICVIKNHRKVASLQEQLHHQADG